MIFHTCNLTPLEANLTAVAWRAKKSWSSGTEVCHTFSVAHRELRSFLMDYEEFPRNFVVGAHPACTSGRSIPPRVHTRLLGQILWLMPTQRAHQSWWFSLSRKYLIQTYCLLKITASKQYVDMVCVLCKAKRCDRVKN